MARWDTGKFPGGPYQISCESETSSIMSTEFSSLASKLLSFPNKIASFHLATCCVLGDLSVKDISGAECVFSSAY